MRDAPPRETYANPSEKGWHKLFQTVEGFNLTNKFMNVIGVVGTIMNIYYFVDTLYQMKSGDISIGLYFQSFVIVLMFLLFISLANYNISKKSAFVIFMSSCYAVILTMILLATYFIAAEVLLKYGNDILPKNGNSFNFFESRSGLAIFMYLSALFGATYFLARSHKAVSMAASIPVFLMFLWLAFVLVFQRKIQLEFANGIKLEAIFGYTIITVMTLLLIGFARNALRRAS